MAARFSTKESQGPVEKSSETHLEWETTFRNDLLYRPSISDPKINFWAIVWTTVAKVENHLYLFSISLC